MSAYCVFGVTKDLIDKELLEKRNLNFSFDELFEKIRPKQVSANFDAPQFCEEWIAMAKKTTKTRSLKVMQYAPKKDKSGNERKSKKGNILKGWVVYEKTQQKI
jgi:hypothetical protein